MNISIIIPTYNRANLIQKTINSFLNQQYDSGQIEIIIVDNKSTDNTLEIINNIISQNKTDIVLNYLFESRQGVHFARNSAAKIAKYDLLYFTDDDMIADKFLLQEIIKPFQFDPNVGTATGSVLPIWESNPPKWIINHFANQYLSLLENNDEFLITRKIKFLYSCHQAVLKKVFFECEGFNPEYYKDKYMGDGETGLNNKIEAKGYKFGYISNSIIFHIIPKNRLTQKYINKRFMNGASSHAYSEFRITKSIYKIFRRIFLDFLIHLPITIFKIIFSIFYKRDITLLHFIPAEFAYYFQKLLYNLKIISNKNFREFILKNDWLSNDNFDKQF